MRIRSEGEWRSLLAEYRSSKEPASMFCKRHQMRTSTLYYQLAKAANKPKDSLKMLPVVHPLVRPIDSVELVLAKGMALRFSQSASAAYVASIIKALA
jgi:hypothetical protein